MPNVCCGFKQIADDSSPTMTVLLAMLRALMAMMTATVIIMAVMMLLKLITITRE